MATDPGLRLYEQTALSLGVFVATSVSAVMVLRSGHRDGDDGAGLLALTIRFVDHLSLAQDEVEQCGQDSTQVQGLIDALLAHLADAALTEHRPDVLAPQRRRGTTGAGLPTIRHAPSRAQTR